MSSRKTERALDTLVEAVPSALKAAALKPNSCILSTRLGVEWLRAHRIRAQALPVRLLVFNAAGWELAQAAQPMAEWNDARVAEWNAVGAWSVGIGIGTDGGGWDGHLVVIADGRYLVDLSAGQVQRLRRGIRAEAFWTKAPILARGQQEGFRAEDGCVWLYEPTGDRSYLKMPAWSGYRVSIKQGHIVSERFGPRPEAPVAGRVAVPL